MILDISTVGYSSPEQGKPSQVLFQVTASRTESNPIYRIHGKHRNGSELMGSAPIESVQDAMEDISDRLHALS